MAGDVRQLTACTILANGAAHAEPSRATALMRLGGAVRLDW